VLCLAGVNKHAGLRVVGSDQWRATAGVDDADRFTDGWEVEVRAFDRPGGKLDDLFCRESFLCDESTDNHVTDAERIGGG